MRGWRPSRPPTPGHASSGKEPSELGPPARSRHLPATPFPPHAAPRAVRWADRCPRSGVPRGRGFGGGAQRGTATATQGLRAGHSLRAAGPPAGTDEDAASALPGSSAAAGTSRGQGRREPGGGRRTDDRRRRPCRWLVGRSRGRSGHCDPARPPLAVGRTAQRPRPAAGGCNSQLQAKFSAVALGTYPGFRVAPSAPTRAQAAEGRVPRRGPGSGARPLGPPER